MNYWCRCHHHLLTLTSKIWICIASSSSDVNQTKFSFIIIMTMTDNCLTRTNDRHFGQAWNSSFLSNLRARQKIFVICRQSLIYYFPQFKLDSTMEINVELLGRRTRGMSGHEGMHWVIVFEFGWVYWMKIFIIFMDGEAV